jgi:hypothetical protein
MQIYTLQERYWQRHPEQAKELPEDHPILQHLSACKAALQQRLQNTPSHQRALDSMCEDMSRKRSKEQGDGPWVGSKNLHFQNTFEGKICKAVPLNLTPGSKVGIILSESPRKCYIQHMYSVRVLQ